MFHVSAAALARALGLSAALLAVVVPAFAAGNAAAGKAKAAVCAGCHGADGNGGADPTWQKLAGQHENYLVGQLQALKFGTRKDPVMSGMAAPLSQKDIADISAYFASLSIKAGAAKSRELADRGARIYRGGNAKTGVSACMSCHGPSGHGIPPRFPRVSSQSAAYAEKQLLAFKSAKRSSDSEIMTRIAFRMSEAEIKAVSEYMAGLH
jgi:cytochrome c553